MPRAQCLWFLLDYTELVFICYFYALVGDFWKLHGMGLIVPGSLIYTNIHFHRFVYITGFTVLWKITIMFLIDLVPISGSPLSGGLLAVILLIWFCKSATILFHNWICNSWLPFRWYVKKWLCIMNVLRLAYLWIVLFRWKV